MQQYLERNRWLYTVVGLAIFLASPLLASTYGAGFTLPGWLLLAVSLVACVIIGVQVRMTDTLSARIFRAVATVCAIGGVVVWLMRFWQGM